jgi:diguanylate cyclase (GGDEF)-like protein
MEEEGIKEQVESTFKKLDSFMTQNEKKIASFENRITKLYGHKKLIRGLKAAILKIYNRDKEIDDSPKNKKEVKERAEDVKKFLAEFKLLYGVKEDTKKLEKKELSLLRESMEDIKERWSNLNEFNKHAQGLADNKKKKKDYGALKHLIQTLGELFSFEKEEYNLISSRYSELIRRFNDYIEKQQKLIKKENQKLDEIIKEMVSPERFLNKEILSEWLFSCRRFRQDLEHFLKKEKQDCHSILDMLLKRTAYARRRAQRIIEEGEKLDEDEISRDLQSFREHSEFSEYYRILNKEYGIDMPEKYKKILRKAGVKLPDDNIVRKIKWLFSRGIEREQSTSKKDAQIAENKGKRDKVTGLASRFFLDEDLKNDFISSFCHKEYKKYKSSFMMVDIDDFSDVNNTYGHTFGDEILKTIAKTIKKSIRSNDLAIRYGGDEIFIILPNTKINKSKKVAERIAKNVKKATDKDKNKDLEILANPITLSIGICELPRDLNESDLKEIYNKITELHQNVSENIEELKEVCETFWERIITVADERGYYVKKEKDKDGIEINKRKARD